MSAAQTPARMRADAVALTASEAGRSAAWRDYVTLTKPSITRMCLVMTGAGLWLAPGEVAWLTAVFAMVGTALAVGSANALNMWWERDTDPLMARTKDRPLAAGRMLPARALGFGVGLGVAAVFGLWAAVNLVTASLGAFALLSYVLVYTPMKYRSPLALVIGAVPGAVPPLMGWTAVTGELGAGGLALFGLLLVWQMPHFLAIALFRKDDYAAAGIRTVPVVRGDRIAKLQAVAWATALLPVSLVLTPLGIAGTLYFVVALVGGLGFLALALAGLREGAGIRWAYQLFGYSLVYLPVVSLALALDVGLS